MTYEEAKLFDTVITDYYENEKLVEPYLENGSSTDTDFRVDLSDLKELFNKWSKKVSAPTIAEVLMWLYEKHGIWIIADPSVNFECWAPRVFTKSDTNLGKYKGVLELNSPTEAYESAIEYVLKEVIN